MDGCGCSQGSHGGSHQAPSVLQGQECLGAREFSPRCEINGMVPCLLWWELVKGFLGEDISEVVILGQHHVLKGLAFLSLLCFLGQPLQWGIHSPNVVSHPLRGDECSINRISRFHSIILHHASMLLPSTLRRALRHGANLASPVYVWIVMQKPQLSH